MSMYLLGISMSGCLSIRWVSGGGVESVFDSARFYVFPSTRLSFGLCSSAFLCSEFAFLTCCCSLSFGGAPSREVYTSLGFGEWWITIVSHGFGGRACCSMLLKRMIGLVAAAGRIVDGVGVGDEPPSHNLLGVPSRWRWPSSMSCGSPAWLPILWRDATPTGRPWARPWTVR